MRYLVKLKDNWPSDFRRCVRFDPESGEQVLQGGEIARVLEFSPGQVAELSEEDFFAVAADIGVCLENVSVDKKGRSRVSDEPVLAAENDEASDDEKAGSGDPAKSVEAPKELVDDDGPLAISKLALRKPIVDALLVAGLEHIPDLVEFRTKSPLTEIKGIGLPSAKEIEEVLDKLASDSSDSDA